MKFLALLFPHRCLACGHQPCQGLGLCRTCLEQVEFFGPKACIRCGRWHGAVGCVPPDHCYHRVLALAPYRGTWRQAVQAVKFGRDRQAAVAMAAALVAAARQAGLSFPDVVVPVPSAGDKWQFYQLTRVVAAEVARLTGVKAADHLGRRPGRPPQVELSRQQRLQGLPDFIFARDEVPGQLVWLVDDVFTTGATADACAGALLSAGARAVYVLVLAA